MTAVHLLLMTFIPTMWGYSCARSFLRQFESKLVILVLAWFFGQFVLVWGCLTTAILVAPYSGDPLSLSLLVVLLAQVLGYIRWNCIGGASLRLPRLRLGTEIFTVAVVALCLSVSSLFFWHHLALVDGTIFRSALYWDFPGQYSMVQSFIAGHNFPPKNELYSGAPLAYHYFFFLWVALYGALGGELTTAINVVSIASFAAVLALVVGVTEEFSKNRVVALLALLLGLTTASYRWLDLLLDSSDRTLFVRLASPFYFKTSPDSVALTSSRRFGYNGNLFNLFYFLQERQLAVGCILLLVCAVILLRRPRFTALQSLMVGVCFGLCVQWHVYCLVVIGLGLGLILLWDSPRRNTLLMLIPLSMLAGVQLWILRTGIQSEYFSPAFSNVPRYDPRFATAPGKYPLSFTNLLFYWYFALGAKVILIPAGIVLLASRCRRSIKIFLVLLVPAFLLTNTVRFAPLSIFDNHKWIRPALLLSETLTAVALYWLLVHSRRSYRIMGWVLVPVLTLSGVFEGYGYFRSQRMVKFASYTSSLSTEVRARSKPGDVFASSNPRDILLSGRTMYVTELSQVGGNPRMDHNFLDISTRMDNLRALYASSSLPELCYKSHVEGINFIELNLAAIIRMKDIFRNENCVWPAAQSTFGRWVRMIDVSCACRDFLVLWDDTAR